jgi:acyl dehydratase
MLYSLGVGAGQDPLRELDLATETGPHRQRALPTMAIVIGMNGTDRPSFGDIDRTKLVHAEQRLELHAELPVEGEVELTTTICSVHDKGSGALITWQTVGRDPAASTAMFTATSAAFLIGAGGFGGERGPRSSWRSPERDPDDVATMTTRPEQALLYRLSGDRNPLHSDPQFARRAGYPQPILHGLCSYGFAARELVGRECDGDTGRFRSISARFSKPTFPGVRLRLRLWRDSATEVLFQVLNEDNAVVIDHGRFVHA